MEEQQNETAGTDLSIESQNPPHVEVMHELLGDLDLIQEHLHHIHTVLHQCLNEEIHLQRLGVCDHQNASSVKLKQ